MDYTANHQTWYNQPSLSTHQSKLRSLPVAEAVGQGRFRELPTDALLLAACRPAWLQITSV